MWSQKERESLGGKSPSFSVRIYRENEGSRSRRGGREGVVRVSVAIYPVEGDMYLSSTRSSSAATRSPLLSRRVITSEMKEKLPRGGDESRFHERRPVLLYAAWTLPPIEARQLFIRSQPRKTGHLVSRGRRIQRKVASIIRG